ncbi:MAG: Glu/Leu/Phe/Val dehydrogenase family protein, partial [Dehalococcoidia bacterium]
LVSHLLKDEVQLVVTDIYEGALNRARDLGATIVGPDEIYDVECDIFSPNALGGVLNSETIPRLKCDIVAGGANNQLQRLEDAETLTHRGILYAPDYIINAGGIINASCEVGATYSEARARQKTERIYDTTQRVIHIAAREGITTAQAADRLAEERIEAVRSVRRA